MVRYQACLEDRGWEYTPHSPTTGEWAVPPEQIEIFKEATQECMFEAGGFTPNTAENLGETYDRWLLIAKCLRERGYQVEEPPSRDAYIEQAADPKAETWQPYPLPGQDSQITLDEFYALQETCGSQ